jgi:cysteine synthase
MVRDALARGVLVRGEPGLVVEGTAGNTGIGLALAAAAFGFRALICIPVGARYATHRPQPVQACNSRLPRAEPPARARCCQDTQSEEKKDALRWAGAQVVEV